MSLLVTFDDGLLHIGTGVHSSCANKCGKPVLIRLRAEGTSEQASVHVAHVVWDADICVITFTLLTLLAWQGYSIKDVAICTECALCSVWALVDWQRNMWQLYCQFPLQEPYGLLPLELCIRIWVTFESASCICMAC